MGVARGTHTTYCWTNLRKTASSYRAPPVARHRKDGSGLALIHFDPHSSTNAKARKCSSKGPAAFSLIPFETRHAAGAPAILIASNRDEVYPCPRPHQRRLSPTPPLYLSMASTPSRSAARQVANRSPSRLVSQPEGRPSLSRKESQESGGWGPIRQIALEESGELDLVWTVCCAAFPPRAFASA